LRLAGFTPEQLATMLSLDVDMIQAYFDQYKITPGAERILALHHQGVVLAKAEAELKDAPPYGPAITLGQQRGRREYE
jgi:hypothetical protein